MTKVSVATSEITRVASWGLRALGCPIGAVDRMAKLLAMAETLDGGCLQTLRLDEARLIKSFKSRPPAFVRKDKQCGIVDASARTFLDVGPRTMDLLTGMAKINGTARIHVHGASDLLGLSGACTLAANRGIAVLAVTKSAEAANKDKWALYAKTPSGIQAVSGGAEDEEKAILDTLQSAGIVEASLTDIPAPEAAGRDETDESGFAVDFIGFAHHHIVNFEAKSPRRSSGDLRLSDISHILLAAHANGVEVDIRDLQHLYELEARTWAPSSERSRMQAGFGTPVRPPSCGPSRRLI